VSLRPQPPIAAEPPIPLIEEVLTARRALKAWLGRALLRRGLDRILEDQRRLRDGLPPKSGGGC
jgi:hypothetical protein